MTIPKHLHVTRNMPTEFELPDNYQTLLRGEKEALLWQRALDGQYPEGALPNEWPSSLALLKLTSTPHDRVSLDRVSDEMPPGRVKLIHRYGSVAKFAWKAFDGHPYTGIFQSGGSGLARVSRAVKSQTRGLPGLALKVFVDGKASTNIFAMPSAERDWSDQNPFSLPYSNRINVGNSGRGKILRAIFNWAFAETIRQENTTDLEATYMPLDGLAKITCDGTEVDKHVRPEIIILQPSKHAQMPSAREPDFRIKLGELEPGMTMFSIYALHTKDSSPEKIGELSFTSRFIASRYSDETLFFQHDRGPTKPE
ncbi:MAG: hypothetical protein V7700_03505 [Halioglobus sp.]